MNHIDQLISQYCPAGVPMVRLGEVCKAFAGGTPLTSCDEYYDGDIPWIRSGEVDFNRIYFADRNITKLGVDSSSAKWIKAKSVLMAMTGATVAKVATLEIPATANQSVCALEPQDSVNYRFLYYYLEQNYHTIQGMAQGALTSLNLALIKSISIPLPPLPVQEEIVRILDAMSNLVTNLDAEISARQKQYEHAREKLLTFGEEVERKTLKNIVLRSCSGSTPSKSCPEFYEGGTIPWLRTQDVKFNEITTINSFITNLAVQKTSAKWIPENCVIVAISGATAGRCAINKIKTTTNQHCLNLEINADKALYKYVFICVRNQYDDLIMMKQGARGDLNASSILSLTIPLPPLSVQQSIVERLDKMESLIQNLQAERDLRQKQYEFYREKLLTF